MTEIQSPKFAVKDGKLIHRSTGKPVPDDEPVFILLASDVFAWPTLSDYAHKLPSGAHRNGVEERAIQFEEFSTKNPERMKDPTGGI